jgi:anti-sigma factor RsiW
MDCKTVRTCSFAFIDDALDVPTTLDLQAHLDQCAECASRVDFELQFRRQLRERAVRYALPDVVERRLWKEIDRLDEEDRGTRTRRRLFPPFKWAAGLAATAALALAVLVLVPWRGSEPPTWALSAVDGHIRALQAAHPLEVESSDRHTVKPWFSGKIDFAFSLPDLTDTPFQLLGGRLEYLADQRAAQVFYQIRQHRISVFILPHPQGEADLSAMTGGQQKGFQYVVVQRPMLTYALISDVNPQDLQTLARLFAEASL